MRNGQRPYVLWRQVTVAYTETFERPTLSKLLGVLVAACSQLH